MHNYQITQKKRKKAFAKLATRQIPLQIILENKPYVSYQNYFQQMQNEFSGNQSVAIRSDEAMGTTYVHAKMMVNEDAFRIQTANLTKSSFQSNREHFYYDTHPGVRQSLVKLFDADWQGKPIKAEDLHPNLVVCPINCRGVIESLLKAAKHTIKIQTQYIVDPQILAILAHQASRLELKLLLADTQDNQTVVEYFGTSTARILASPYNHTKMILVDDKYLLLGSMNLSDTSLDKNREI